MRKTERAMAGPRWENTLRRLIIALPSLLGISLVLFVLLALAPGDPFSELATNTNIPPEVRAALRVKFGIDDPILVRYVRRWLLCCKATGAFRSQVASTSTN